MAHLRRCKYCGKTFLTVLAKSKICDECKNDSRIIQGVKYSNPEQRKELLKEIKDKDAKKCMIGIER